MRLAFGLAFAALLSGTAHAHHGWSSYEPAKVTKFSAHITKVSYENPHGMIFVSHEGVEKEIYLAPPARMMSRGLEKEALTVGKTVTIEAYPSRSAPDELRAERITVDGKVVELR